ncbi:MAG: Sec-independent protein translocase protein TatB [Mesorhizobium sp.]
MFDIGWTEMLVIAIVMIVVVGPKDLPRMLRTFGKTTAKLRSMAGDFQKQFNEALKEAELDDVKKSVDELRSLDPRNEIRKQLNPFEKAAQDVRAGLDSLKQPSAPAADPAASAVHPAEPLKNGATEMPNATASAVNGAIASAGPTAMPSAAALFPVMSDPAPAAVNSEPAKATAAVKAKAAAKPAAIKPKPADKVTTAKRAAKSAPAKPAAKGAPKPGTAGKNKAGTAS